MKSVVMEPGMRGAPDGKTATQDGLTRPEAGGRGHRRNLSLASRALRDPLQRHTAGRGAPLGSGVIQLAALNKLRIGITGSQASLGFYANGLPHNTYVWILTNEAADADALDNAGVTKGNNQSSPNQIIAANGNSVSTPIFHDQATSNGKVVSRIFQSGPFRVPRQNKPQNRNEVDYSFLRFAAIESYRRWYAAVGQGLGWPSATADTTQVETIDTDQGGITGPTSEVATDENGKIKTDWLAEAGVYAWDWSEVKGHNTVAGLFTAQGNLDATTRDRALASFAAAYTKAEIDARKIAAASDIFKIYFPEPATRLNPAAITLLANSGFGNMAATRGTQLGHKRESVGLIAGLVHLDMNASNINESRAKAKLKFNPSFKVTTGLGARKDAYVAAFAQWCAAAQADNYAEDAVDISTLNAAKNFDQSYLSDQVPTQVQKWHNDTLTALGQEQGNKIGGAFFKPK